MSNLDQAFIKAYRKSKSDRPIAHRRHAEPVAAHPTPAGNSSIDTTVAMRIDSPATEVAPIRMSGVEQSAHALPTPHISSFVVAAPAGLAETVETARITNEALRVTTAAVIPPRSHLPPVASPAPSTTKRPATAAPPTATPRAEAPLPAAKTTPPAKPVIRPQPASAPMPDLRPTDAPAPATSAPSKSAPAAVPAPLVEHAPRLRPLFEVEKLPWPKICGSLAQAAEKELDHVADALIAGGRAGRKLVLLGAAHRGAGCTTTLLCLARQLSVRGHSIALVDGDFQQAQLVRQVKLLPQAGWENVLRGEVPLEEALIEAVGDRITILPLMAPLIEHEAVVCRDQIAAGLRRLRDEYDLVLVDSSAATEAAGELDALLSAARFDAAIVVRDARSGRADGLETITGRLAAAGIPSCDIAENFVAT